MNWYFAYGSNMNPVRLVDDRILGKAACHPNARLTTVC
jgi:hypothetical protein